MLIRLSLATAMFVCDLQDYKWQTFELHFCQQAVIGKAFLPLDTELDATLVFFNNVFMHLLTNIKIKGHCIYVLHYYHFTDTFNAVSKH